MVFIIYTGSHTNSLKKNYSEVSQYINEINNKANFLSKKILSKVSYNKKNILRDDDDDDSSILMDLGIEIGKFLFSHSNISILIVDLLDNETCNQTLFDIGVNNTNITQIINNSAKSLSDVGLENDCINFGLFYLFMEIKVQLKTLFNNTEYYYLYRFLNQSSFFTGLCLPWQCYDLYTNFLNKSLNQKFFSFLETTYGVTHITNYSVETLKPTNTLISFLLIYFTIGYVAFKLIISVAGLCIYGLKMGHEDSNSADDDSSEESDISINDNFQEGGPNLFSRNSIASNSRYSKIKGIFYKFWKIISISKNLMYLTTLKNKYYDDSNLVYVSFFRIITIFWYIFNHNVYALIKIPHKDYTNYNFFTSIWFSIIKYSTFSCECWVVLNGFIMAFNLMNYLKNYKIHNPSKVSVDYKVYLKFYFTFSSKILLFIMTYTIMHIYLENLNILGDSPIIKYYLANINNSRMCYNNPWSIFTPFYFQYLSGDSETSPGFKNCYRYINMVINEFYCFTILMIIFYLIHRLKSKIFDIVISLIILCNIILSWFSFPDILKKNGEIYNFNFILGDVIGISYTHLYMNSYFLGILTGMTYFYYKDVISSNSLQLDLEYIPFRFTYDFMMIIDCRSKLTKKLLFYSSFLFQVMISMSYYFFIYFYSDNSNSNVENKFNIKTNWVISFFYVYEKKIFLIFYIVFILTFLLDSKRTPLKLLLNSNVFIPYNRIDTALLSLIDSSVYLFYCLFNFEIYLNLQNMVLLTCGLVVYVSILAIIFWCCFELPLRIIYVSLFSLRPLKSIKTIS